MKNFKRYNQSLDLSTGPCTRHLLLALFSYVPPFSNGLYGFPGIKHLLLIFITHRMPLWVYQWVSQNESRFHGVFIFLRKHRLF